MSEACFCAAVVMFASIVSGPQPASSRAALVRATTCACAEASGAGGVAGGAGSVVRGGGAAVVVSGGTGEDGVDGGGVVDALDGAVEVALAVVAGWSRLP